MGKACGGGIDGGSKGSPGLPVKPTAVATSALFAGSAAVDVDVVAAFFEAVRAAQPRSSDNASNLRATLGVWMKVTDALPSLRRFPRRALSPATHLASILAPSQQVDPQSCREHHLQPTSP